jgi:hypothetical protein
MAGARAAAGAAAAAAATEKRTHPLETPCLVACTVRQFMSGPFAGNANAAQMMKQPSGQSAYWYFSNSNTIHQLKDEHAIAKKQKTIWWDHGSMGIYTNTANDHASRMTNSMNVVKSTERKIEDGTPFEKQPPPADAAKAPPLQMQFQASPVVLITAFSYERYIGLVPFLPTVMQEAEHISVCGSPVIPNARPAHDAHYLSPMTRRRCFPVSGSTTRMSPSSKRPFPAAKRGSSWARAAPW